MIDVYKVLQGEKSTSSGTGGSYYSIAAACGMRSRLNDLFPIPQQEEEYELGQLTPTGRPKVNGKRAGAFFHKLQELWRMGDEAVGNLVVQKGHIDIDYEVAATSFKNYREFYGNSIENRGRILSAERKYPETPEQVKLVADWLGGEPFTIRYDLLVEIDQWKSNELADRHGVYVRPGRWIVDYKLVAPSVFEKNQAELPSSFQCLSYPLIYNLCNPDAPVEGLLLDITSRVAKAEAKHYALVLAEVSADAEAIVRDGVRMAAEAKRTGVANPFACNDKYGQCIFLKNGLCPRYGTFDQHKERFETAKENS